MAIIDNFVNIQKIISREPLFFDHKSKQQNNYVEKIFYIFYLTIQIYILLYVFNYFIIFMLHKRFSKMRPFIINILNLNTNKVIFEIIK